MAAIPLLDAFVSKKAKEFTPNKNKLIFNVKYICVFVILEVHYSNCFEQNRKQEVVAHSKGSKNIWDECYDIQKEILFSNGKD